MNDALNSSPDLSSEKRALLAKRLRAKSDPTQLLMLEPIAIVGMGCRFPGGADSPAAFWELMRDGRDAITEVPTERWDSAALYDPNPAAPGKVSTRWGAFLTNVDQFDADFFGITPREAAQMDPQQRLLLEVAWEALEDSGHTREQLAGSATGVFVGVCASDYGWLQFADTNRIDAYASTGSALSIVANRLSYQFDLRGPSVAVDSACSSSLVAVHLACRSLLLGESRLAIAGGVNLILSPHATISFSKWGMMATDGRCKTFDAQANGFVRGEGCGIVVLKRLSDALADGDRVLAVVRGSAVNQDGRSSGLTAPNSLAQRVVVRDALRSAGVAPGQVSYVETHGTGTALGDPIEVEALADVLGQPGSAGGSCVLGAVKTNIGHLEAAAGIAGLIKVVLAYQHEVIPANLHFKALNPHISLRGTRFMVPTQPLPWAASAARRFAGVSSFGFGGTNAHLVLEEAPRLPEPSVPATEPERAYLLPLSAHTPQALQAQLESYLRLMRQPAADRAALHDICYTATVRRTHHLYRQALVGSTTDEMGAQIEAMIAATPATPSAAAIGDGPVFVFSGQGAQWVGMGRALLDREPVFRAAVARCDELFRTYAGWSILDELTASHENSRLEQTEVAQPLIFALQVGLAALWQTWGIVPSAVVGHSVGEIAAAYVAGALRLEDALRIVFHRGVMMQRTANQGHTAMIELPLAEVETLLTDYDRRITVAAINSPCATVVAGDATAIEHLLATLGQRGIFARSLGLSYAFHSPILDPLLPEFQHAIRDIAPQPTTLPLISTVTGTVYDGRLLDRDYWGRNMRAPVRFAAAIETLLHKQHTIFLEVSAHPVLKRAITQCAQQHSEPTTVLSSLRRDHDEQATLLRTLGALYMRGYGPRWTELYQAGRVVQLPGYSWQHERFWLTPPAVAQHRSEDSQADATGSPLLGRHTRLAYPAQQHVWDLRIDRRQLPYLDDHRIYDVVILPGTAYVEMALAAATQALGAGPHTLAELEFRQAMFLEAASSPVCQIVLSVGEQGAATFQIHSHTADPEHSDPIWTLHARGSIQPYAPDVAAPTQLALAALQSSCPLTMTGEDYYQALARRGLQYGPCFRGIQQLWYGDGVALGRVQVPQPLINELVRYQLHPALLDICSQVLGAALPVAATDDVRNGPYVPVGIDEVVVVGKPGRTLWSYAQFTSQQASLLRGDVQLSDQDGRVVVELRGLQLQRLEQPDRQPARAPLNDWLYELQWQPSADPAEPQTMPGRVGGTWVIFADQGEVGRHLAAHLTQHGAQPVLVSAGPHYVDPKQGQAQVCPTDHADIQRLFDALQTAGQRCDGVIHLWNLDLPARESLTGEQLLSAQALGTESIVYITQALARSTWPTPPQLWLATRGAQAVSAMAQPRLAQAPAWGLGRAIAQEHPALWGGMVDLDPEATQQAAAFQLWQSVQGSADEDQLAFRHGQRYALRLQRVQSSRLAPRTFAWRADGSYLITGGLGRLGLQLARWLVEQGARHLILISRTALPPRAAYAEIDRTSQVGMQISTIEALERAGAQVHLAAVDVSDAEQLYGFLDRFAQSGHPPICGVIHAAGQLQDRTVQQLDPASLYAVLRPKLIGSWLLHQYFAQHPLDCFVLFSSAASMLRAPGQGNYAAANSFLDALAHYRHAVGQPALAINWGAWGASGMATDGDRAARLARQGMGMLVPEQALEVLGQLLHHEACQLGVMAIDWPRLWQANPEVAAVPLLRQLTEAAQTVALLQDDRRLGGTLRAAHAQERAALLQTYLTNQVAHVLGLPAAKLNLQQSLQHLGMDSLMALELKNWAEVELGISVPMVQFLQGPSIAQLTTLVLAQLADQPETSEQPAGTAQPASAGSVLAQVEANDTEDWEVGAL